MKDLPKDSSSSIRINSKVKEALKREGVTVQELLDKAIEDLFNIEVEIKITKKESK